MVQVFKEKLPLLKNNSTVIKIGGGYGGNGACYNQGNIFSFGTTG